MPWTFYDKYGQQRVQSGAPTAGVILRKVTPKQVINSIAETDLLNGEAFVVGGTMGPTGKLRLVASGDWLQNSGAAQAAVPRFKLKLGGVVLLDTGAMGNTNDIQNTTIRKGWRIEAEIQDLTVTTQWADLIGKLSYVASATGLSTRFGNFATGEGSWVSPVSTSPTHTIMDFEGGNSGAVDMTTDHLVELAVILPVAHASVDITLKQAMVVLL